MENLDLLKLRWKEAKGTRTIPDIAECADLSPNTVEYAMSGRSSNPSLETVVRISRELNVSLDDVFDIRAAPDELSRRDAEHWKSRFESSEQQVLYLRRILSFLCALFLIVFAWALSMDFNCTSVGFYRGEWTAAAVISLVLLGIAAMIVAALFVVTVRRKR